MTPPDLQRDIGVFTNFSAAAIDQTFRALRATKLIPTSHKGLPAIELTPEHVAYILIALAIDDTPAGRAEKVLAWATMSPRKDNTTFFSFVHALETILRDPCARLRLSDVRVCREWPYAAFSAGDERVTYEFGFRTPDEARAHGFRVTPCRSEFVLSGGALQQLAINLATPEMAATIIG
jgi:hypothetical protein